MYFKGKSHLVDLLINYYYYQVLLLDVRKEKPHN